MKEFTIGKNDAGQRLDKFITKTLPSLPKALMYKYLRLRKERLVCHLRGVHILEHGALRLFVIDEHKQNLIIIENETKV